MARGRARVGITRLRNGAVTALPRSNQGLPPRCERSPKRLHALFPWAESVTVAERPWTRGDAA